MHEARGARSLLSSERTCAPFCHRWLCAQQSNDSAWREFDCNWVGSFLYPTSLRPRQAARIHTMNKDEWFDSLTLAQASAPLSSLLHHQNHMKACSLSFISLQILLHA